MVYFKTCTIANIFFHYDNCEKRYMLSERASAAPVYLMYVWQYFNLQLEYTCNKLVIILK